MKITMKDFIAAARQGGEIVLTEDRRVEGTGGTLSGRKVQVIPTNPTDPMTQQLRQQTLGRKLQKAFEHKYMYGRKIQKGPLLKKFFSPTLKASDIDQLVVEGKKIRQSTEFKQERFASEVTKAWIKDNQKLLAGYKIDHRNTLFRDLAYEGPNENADDEFMTEWSGEEKIEKYLRTVVSYVMKQEKVPTEDKHILLDIFFHPSMTRINVDERLDVIHVFMTYYSLIIRKDFFEHRRGFADKDWQEFFGLSSVEGMKNSKIKNNPDFISELLRMIVTKKCSYFGSTYLYRAILSSWMRDIRLILKYGADVQAVDCFGKTPLDEAVAWGHFEIGQLLIEHGADLNAGDYQGRTPLSYLIGTRNMDMIHWIHWMIERGADINGCGQPGETPLHTACGAGNFPVVKLLLDLGARVPAADKDGKTPLQSACGAGNFSIVKLLLEHGAEVNTVDKSGQTPLCKACLSGNIQIVKLLLDNGAKPNIEGNQGDSALHSACLSENSGIVKLLLEHGAEVGKVNEDGDTPLFMACGKDHLGTVTLLFEHGAVVTVNNRGENPLHQACRY